MGQPVVHFEVLGKDQQGLREYFSQLFGWEFTDPGGYGVVMREQNTNADGIGIGGGVGAAPEGHGGHATFYVEVPDVEASLAQAAALGGTRMMGPHQVMPGTEIGMFTDPEGHLIGLVSSGK